MLVTFVQGGELPFVGSSFTLLKQVLGSIYLIVFVACAMYPQEFQVCIKNVRMEAIALAVEKKILTIQLVVVVNKYPQTNTNI